MFDPAEWTLISRTKNPCGEIPMTGGGRSKTDRAERYMADVIAQSQRRDAVSKRHHYVPKGYLKAWSPDGKRVEVVDTATGIQKFQCSAALVMHPRPVQVDVDRQPQSDRSAGRTSVMV